MSEANGASFPTLIIRNASDLADALRAVQNHLQLSNETLEGLAGMCAGSVDKFIGPGRVKGIGATSLDLFLGALAVRLRVEPDLEQAEKMANRWEQRDQTQVRRNTRISREMIEKCRPIVLGEIAQRGWQTRRQRTQAAAAPARARRTPHLTASAV